MRIQRNDDVSFKQRYLMQTSSRMQTDESMKLLRRFYLLWRESLSGFNYLFSENQGKTLFVTGEDGRLLFRALMQPGLQEGAVYDKFAQGAIEFGKEKIEQLGSVIDSSVNYKVDMKKRLGAKNLDTLGYAVSAVDPRKEYLPGNMPALWGEEGVDYVLVAVKDFDKTIWQRENAGRTIGEADKNRKSMLKNYLQTSVEFTEDHAVELVNKIRKILGLDAIKPEDYTSTTDGLILKTPATIDINA